MDSNDFFLKILQYESIKLLCEGKMYEKLLSENTDDNILQRICWKKLPIYLEALFLTVCKTKYLLDSHRNFHTVFPCYM